MAATFQLKPDASPLRVDDSGTIRVGTTRVTLDIVIEAYLEGQTPEQIASELDTLDLGDVYGAIAHYHHHKAEIEAYLEARRAQSAALHDKLGKKWPSAGLRAELIERMRRKANE